MRKLKIFLFILLNILLISSCRDSESSNDDNSPVTISGYISTSLNSAKSANNITLEDVKYIAAVPINNNGSAYWVELSENGQFLFTVDQKGSYIFKLLDDYGLTKTEIGFGNENYSIYSVQDSTDFGSIEIDEENNSVIVSDFSGSKKDSSNINETLVNTILVSLLESILEKSNKGEVDYSDENSIAVTLIINRSSNDDGSYVEQRVNLQLENDSGDYGELNFKESISISINQIDANGNDLNEELIHSSEDYLADNTTSVLNTYSEELIKISSLINNLSDTETTAYSDFEEISKAINSGTSLDEASSTINSSIYETIIEESVNEAETAINGGLTSMEITTLPNKTIYSSGDSFDSTGLEITAIYQDSSSEILDNSEISFSDFDNSSTGAQTITATYKEKSITFDITISSSYLANKLKTITIGSASYNVNVEYYSDTFGYSVENEEVTISDCLLSETSVTIPDSIDGYPVTTIGFGAFFYNKLTSITLPDSITKIEDHAFRYNSLVSIEIPNTVTEIGNYAFKDNSLTSISIPDSTTKIGTGAFESNNIETLTLSSSLTEITDYAFYENAIITLNIPSGITKIGNYAFKNNSLNNVSLPDSLTSIGDHAFYGNKITEISIPDTVTEIGNYAFKDNSLTSISIPDSITKVGAGAFENNSLTSVTLPDSVTEIGSFAFYGNDLTEITLPDAITQIENLAFADNAITAITFPESITGLGEGAFYDNNLTEVTLPESITEIEGHAFGNNSNLTEIYIPATVTTIDESAFSNASEEFVILGEAGSIAATYAEDNGLEFELDLGAFAITTQPNKTTYYTGDFLDYTGLIVAISYSSGEEDIIDNTKIVFSGFDNTKTGTQTITATYGEFSDTFDISMIQLELTNLEITNEPDKTSYYTGDSFDYTGLIVNATYNSGNSGEIDNSSLMYVGYDNTITGSQTISVSSGSFTDTFDITMIETAIENIAITNEANKTSYYTGDSFDYTGLVVTANYNNGITSTIDNSTVTFSGFDNTKSGSQTITVTYETYTSSFDITIAETSIDSIVVTTQPTKTAYYTGDSFNYSGLVITASYNNGGSATIDNSNITFAGFDNANAGTQTITATYNSYMTTFNIDMIDLNISGINITTNANKNTYYTGDSFEYTGLVVTASYNNGDSENIDNSNITFTGFDNSNAGTQTITATYSGKSTTFDITMIELAFTSIEVTTLPSKTSYYTGDSFDETGIVVTGTYNNGDTTLISTNYSFSGFDSSNAGTQTITVTYESLTDTFDITMIQTDIESISVTAQPTKTSYYTGESFEYTGLVITASYNNGDSTIIDNSNITFAGFDNTSAGTQTITTTYNGKSTTFNITMIELAFDSIEVATLPSKTSYYTGDSFDETGIVVTGTYNSGNTENITTSLNYSGFDSSKAGTQTITVTYESLTDSFDITMIQTDIESISVTTQPTKTSYYTGESFDYTGLIVTASYNNGDSATIDNSNITFTGFDNSNAGTQTIMATYSGKSTTFDITMIELAFTNIEVTTLPSKTSYYTGDSFDETGIAITGTYNNGDITLISTNYSFSGFDSSNAGTQTITATYNGLTTTFNITMIELAFNSIEVTTLPSKTSYYTGDSFDETGIAITGTYNNGDTTLISTNYSFSEFDSSNAGTQTITATYNGLTTTFNITMIELAFNSIEVTTLPSKTSYYTGDSFDEIGIVITGTYNNGDTTLISTNYSFSGFDSDNAGTQTITVTYKSLTDTFDINIVDTNISSIDITTQPDKTLYYTGDSFEYTGIVVTATYNNGYSETIDNSTLAFSGFDNTNVGAQTITTTYSGKSTTFDITMIQLAFTSIDVTTLPNKTSYYTGDSFDETGLVITGTYNSGATNTIENSNITFTGFDNSNAGTQTITATYNGLTTTFNITMIELAYSSLAVTTQPNKTSYYTGDSFDETGLVITGTYNSGATNIIENSSITFTGFDNSNAGTQTITATYNGLSTTFNINMTTLAYSSLAVTTQPTKTSYYTGESFEYTGLVVTGAYNSGATNNIDNSNITFTGFDNSNPGTQTITATYNGLTTTFNITMIELAYSSLAVTTQPNKTSYYTGESFEYTGLVVTGTYNSGATNIIENSSITFTGFDNSNAGTQTITATYNGLSTTFNITMIELAFNSIEVTTLPSKTSYYTGDSFDETGIVVTGTYNSGDTTLISTNYSFSGFDSSNAGTQTITVTFESLTDSFDITMIQTDIESIAVTTQPIKTSYYTGDSFEYTGLVVTASYNNGDSTIIDNSNITFAGFDNTSAGTQTITATYNSYMTTFNIDMIDLNISGINITTNANKNTYYTGDSFEYTGLVVTASYNNGDSVSVENSSLTFTGFDNSNAGTQTITATYSGKSTTFDITMIELAFTSIEITTLPSKTSYYTGESFNEIGIVVTGTYNSGNTENITTSLNYSGFDSSKAGTQTITVTYESLTDTFDITMIQTDIESISVTTQPIKTSYYTGDSFNYSGLVITASYNNGDSATIDNSNITFTGFDNANAGTQTITATYNGLTTTFDITMIELAFNSIEVTTLPSKTSYYTGESFDEAGIVITGTYNSGATNTIENSNITFTGFDNTSAGTQTITATYNGLTTTFNITMIELAFNSIEVTTLPSKTSYYTGDSFDETGIVVTGTYNSGDTASITTYLSYSGFDSSNAGTQTITVTYESLTDSFDITMVQTDIESISVTTQPIKTSYYTGDSFEYTGLVVTASYNNGDSTIIDNSNITFAGFDNTSTGTQTITATYSGKSTTFNITMIELAFTSIEVATLPSKTSYYTGESFNEIGIVVTGTYNSGNTENIATSLNYSGFDSSNAGTQTITVTYESLTDTFDITMIQTDIESIAVTTQPIKTTYYTGDLFNYSGLVITASYNNGDSATIDNSNITFTGFDNSNAGTQTITATYNGLSTTFNITMIELAYSSLAVTTQPNKTLYYTGESFEYTGLVITGTYNSGATNTIENSNITFTGFDNSNAGTQTITATYNGLSTTFNITMIELAYSSLAVTTQPNKTLYYTGESFDETGLVITGTYNSGANDIIDNSNITFTGFDNSTAGTQTITATYNGLSTTFNINMTTLAYSSLTVTTQPTKTSYYTGDSFDETGLVVTGTYNSGANDIIDNSNITFTGFDNSNAGTQTITATYNGLSTTFNITIIELAYSSLAVTTQPNKTSYYTGESFDETGLVITGTYNSGANDIIDNSNITFTGFDNSTAGTQTITATYNGLSTTFNINMTTLAYSSLTVTTQPTKTSYYTGESFEYTGLVVTRTYNSGASDIIDNSNITFAGFDNANAGTQTITATYNGLSTTFNINMTALAYSSLAVTTQPNKTSYYTGESFEYTGLVVTGTYNSGDTDIIENSNIIFTGFDNANAGTQTITATYNGLSTTFNITMIELAYSSLAVTTQPNKTSYYTGESFEYTGLVVTGTYNSGAIDIIDNSNITFTGFDNSNAGTQTITATYNGLSTTFNITIIELAYSSLAVTTQPNKTSYYTGESFEYTGLVITGTYNSGANDIIDNSNITFTGFDNANAGTQTITATYNGLSTTFNITMIELAYSSLAVTTQPNKTSYYTGDSFEYTGLVITGTYNSGATDIIDNSNITFTGFDNSNAGTQTITATYNGLSTTFNITMIELAYSSLAVTTQPNKTSYYTGDSFEYTGLVVTGTYNSGATNTIENSNITFTGFDNSNAGTQTITATYNGLSTTFNINMTALAYSSLAVTTQPIKTTYYTGESFDETGLVITGTYNSGANDIIENSNITFTGFDNTSAGTQTITATHNGLTTTFNITMIELAYSSLAVTTQPNKTSYYTGESFEYTGLVVTGTYNSGATNTIENSNITFTGFDNSNAGTQTITATHNGLTTTFNINMIELAYSSLAVTTQPNKTSYYTGESFEYTGLVVTGTYNSGASDIIENSNITFTGFDNLNAGTQTITATYNGLNTTFDITMIGLSSLDITTEPTKITYLVGDNFDETGLVTTATYTDSNTAVISNSNITFTGFDSNTEAALTITASYQGFSDTFNINVYTNHTSTYDYSNTGGEVTISSYLGSDSDVTIPSTIEGTSVTTIGNNSFESKSLNSISLPSTITSIGDSAFKDNYFTSITLPSSLTTIGEYAFYGNSLGNIALPDSATTIGNYAFAYNSLATATLPSSITQINEGVFHNNSLTSISLPSTITSIGNSAFRDNSLSEVAFPASLTTIGSYAFQDNSLAIAELPMSVTSVSNSAFAYNSALDEVFVLNPDTSFGTNVFNSPATEFTIYGEAGSTAETYANSNSHTFLLDIETLAITTVPTKTSYYIGESLDTSGIVLTATYYNGNSKTLDSSYVNFEYFESVTEGTKTVSVIYSDLQVTFDVNVYIDYSGAYNYSSSGGEITISSYIGSDTIVTIPDTIEGETVTILGANSFEAKSLSSVSLPASLTTIGDSAFKDNYFTSVTLPSTLTNIGEYAFSGNNLGNISLPDSATSIGNYAFADNSLATITFPSTITQINEGVLKGNSFTTITIPDTVTTIGNGALQYNDYLETAYIPVSVTSFGSDIFYMSGTLGNRTFAIYGEAESDAETYANTNGHDFVLNLASLGISATPTTTFYVGDAFNYTGLEASVTYSSGNMGTIDGSYLTFTGFVSSTAGTITVTATHDTFFDTFAIDIVAPSVTDILINVEPYDTSYLVGEAFDNAGLEVTANYDNEDSIIVSNELLTISGFDSSSEGVVTVTVTYEGHSDTFDVNIYTNYTSSFSYSIISDEVTIDSGYDTDVVIPETIEGYPVTTIGNDAFYEMGVTSVSFPDSITNIGDNAFIFHSLTSISLPSNIESIGSNAFEGDSTLTEAYIPSSTVTIGIDAFKDSNSEFILYGEAGSTVETYASDNSHNFLLDLTSFSITTLPANTTYLVGASEGDYSGIEVSVTYSSGNSGTLDETYLTFDGFSSEISGTITITASNGTYSDTFDIDIVE